MQESWVSFHYRRMQGLVHRGVQVAWRRDSTLATALDRFRAHTTKKSSQIKHLEELKLQLVDAEDFEGVAEVQDQLDRLCPPVAQQILDLEAAHYAALQRHDHTGATKLEFKIEALRELQQMQLAVDETDFFAELQYDQVQEIDAQIEELSPKCRSEEVFARIEELEELKENLIEAEDFESVAEIQIELDQLRVGEELRGLESERLRCVRAGAYEEAARVQNEIDVLTIFRKND